MVEPTYFMTVALGPTWAYVLARQTGHASVECVMGRYLTPDTCVDS